MVVRRHARTLAIAKDTIKGLKIFPYGSIKKHLNATLLAAFCKQIQSLLTPFFFFF